MIIGIISDTHDNLMGIKKAIKIFREKKIEMIIHCGDWVSPFTLEFFDHELDGLKIPIKSVVGNNPGDTKRTLLANHKMKNPVEWAKRVTMSLDIEGQKAIVYHGDDKELLQALIDCQKYDIIFTGHTHQARNEKIRKTLVINPGNTCYAREGKITTDISIAIYNSHTKEAKIIYL